MSFLSLNTRLCVLLKWPEQERQRLAYLLLPCLFFPLNLCLFLPQTSQRPRTKDLPSSGLLFLGLPIIAMEKLSILGFWTVFIMKSLPENSLHVKSKIKKFSA